MPRTCTICTHPNRAEIDAALLEGEPLRTIAARWSVSKSALIRHSEHIPPHLAKAHEAHEATEAGTLLERLRALNHETRAVLEDAKAGGNGELQLKALTRLEKQLELEGKLIGELQSGPIVNVTVSPEWLTLRAVVISALLPYPDAAQAVTRALSAPERHHERLS